MKACTLEEEVRFKQDAASRWQLTVGAAPLRYTLNLLNTCLHAFYLVCLKQVLLENICVSRVR